jgi:cobalt-zinc-cadmium efflux system outer membrane protein
MISAVVALVLSAPAPLHLADLLREAQQRNPLIVAAGQRVRAASERVSPAAALEDPMLMVQLWNAPIDFSVVPLMVQVSQPIPLGGKRADRRDAAAAESRVAKAEADAKALEIEQAVKKTYFDLFMAERTEEVDAELGRTVEAVRQAALARVEAGRGESIDVLRLQSESLELQSNMAVARQQAASARIQLATLLDRDPAEEFGRTETPGLLAGLPAVTELRTRALRQRPELQRALAMVDSAQAQRRLAKSERVPDLGVFLGEMHSFRMPGVNDFLFAGVQLNLPIFGGSKNEPRLAAALAEADAARSEQRAVENEIAAQVADELAQVQSEAEIIHLHHQLVPISRQTLESTEAGYAAGHGEFLAVLDAVRELQRHELELAMHLAAYERALADLERAVGGDLGQVAAASQAGADEH